MNDPFSIMNEQVLIINKAKLIIPPEAYVEKNSVQSYYVEFKDHAYARFCTRDIYGIELSLP